MLSDIKMLTEEYIESKVKITRKEPVIILFTNQYEKFKGNVINRNVTKKHSQALLQSLRDNGYYSHTPVLCDQNFVMLDGHHKIAALELYHKETGKRLEFAFRVKYCANDEERLREMQIHNAYKKDWTLKQTIKISNTNYAQFYRSLEKRFGKTLIKLPKNRKPFSLVDYLDPSSVNKAVGIPLSKPDLASKKDISDQDKQDIMKLFEIVYNNITMFRKVPPLKRAFVNNCGKIIGLLDDKDVSFNDWKIYVAEKFDDDTINSEKFVIDLEKNFRKFLKEK